MLPASWSRKKPACSATAEVSFLLQVEIANSCFADKGESTEFLGVAADCKACKQWTAESPSRTVAKNVASKSIARFSVSVPEATGTDEYGRGGQCIASTCLYATDKKFKSTSPKPAPISDSCVSESADYCKMCSYESLPVRFWFPFRKQEGSGSFCVYHGHMHEPWVWCQATLRLLTCSVE